MSAITAGAVIAAGEGSRLKELGVAKPMIEVGGVPLIAHVLGNFEAAGIASAAVIFNESERHCEAFVRERFGKLVTRIVVKTTRSSLESFPRNPRGGAAGPPARLDRGRVLPPKRSSSASSAAPRSFPLTRPCSP